MLTIPEWKVLLLTVGVTAALNPEGLLSVKTESPVTLPELWQMSNLTLTDIYSRYSRIDKWEWWRPVTLYLTPKDIHFNDVGFFKFNTSESSNNLTDALSYARIMSAYPRLDLKKFDTIVRNDYFILADSEDNDLVYFAHGRLNSSLSNLLTCFSKTGSLFHLDQALSSFPNSREIIFSNVYDSTSGVEFIKIDSPVNQIYVNGISVYDFNDSSSTFTFSYATWYGQCVNGQYIDDVKSHYRLQCNGQLHQIDVIKAMCLWIFFTDTAYKVNVTLSGPEDEPLYSTSTASTDTTSGDNSTETTFSMTTYDIYKTTADNNQTNTNVTTTDEKCKCQCNKHITEVELQQIIKQIEKELSIKKSTLSSTIRRKTSASDKRLSAQVVGYVGGLIFAIEIGFLFVMDFIGICKYFINITKM